MNFVKKIVKPFKGNNQNNGPPITQQDIDIPMKDNQWIEDVVFPYDQNNSTQKQEQESQQNPFDFSNSIEGIENFKKQYGKTPIKSIQQQSRDNTQPQIVEPIEPDNSYVLSGVPLSSSTEDDFSYDRSDLLKNRGTTGFTNPLQRKQMTNNGRIAFKDNPFLKNSIRWKPKKATGGKQTLKNKKNKRKSHKKKQNKKPKTKHHRK